MIKSWITLFLLLFLSIGINSILWGQIEDSFSTMSVKVSWMPDFKKNIISVEIENQSNYSIWVENGSNFDTLYADRGSVIEAEEQYIRDFKPSYSKTFTIRLVFIENDQAIEHKYYSRGKAPELLELKPSSRLRIDAKINGGYENYIKTDTEVMAFLVYKGNIFYITRFSKDTQNGGIWRVVKWK